MRHWIVYKAAYLPIIVLLSLFFLGGGIYVANAGLSDGQQRPKLMAKVVIQNNNGEFESKPFEWQSEVVLGKEDFAAKGSTVSLACAEICPKAGKCRKVSKLAAAYILKKCAGASECSGIAEKAGISPTATESVAGYEIILRNVCEA